MITPSPFIPLPLKEKGETFCKEGLAPLFFLSSPSPFKERGIQNLYK